MLKLFCNNLQIYKSEMFLTKSEQEYLYGHFNWKKFASKIKADDYEFNNI